jgi:hypothetical protein
LSTDRRGFAVWDHPAAAKNKTHSDDRPLKLRKEMELDRDWRG